MSSEEGNSKNILLDDSDVYLSDSYDGDKIEVDRGKPKQITI